MTRVDAVVVNYNGGEDLLRCLESLRGQPGIGRIVVVDNGSSDGSDMAAGERFDDVVVHRTERNLGYAGGVNRGATMTTADTLLFLNPDVVLDDGCAAALADALQRAPGVAGPAVRLEALGTTELGSSLDRLGQPLGIRAGDDREPLYVSGCALATNRSVFESLGGMDDRFFMFMEDADYCWRALLAGHSVRVVPGAGVLHRGGAATPGGYARAGRLEVSPFRLLLRERNTMAMLLKCAPWRRLTWALPAYVARIVAIALVMALSGRPQLGIRLLGTLVWNLRELPETLRLRRRAEASSPTRQVAERRLRPVAHSVRALLHSGMPRIVESQR